MMLWSRKWMTLSLLVKRWGKGPASMTCLNHPRGVQGIRLWTSPCSVQCPRLCLDPALSFQRRGEKQVWTAGPAPLPMRKSWGSYQCQRMTNNSEHPVERRMRQGAVVSYGKVMTSNRKPGSVRRVGISDRRVMAYDRKTGISYPSPSPCQIGFWWDIIGFLKRVVFFFFRMVICEERVVISDRTFVSIT